MAKGKEIYAELVREVIADLEAGVQPWRRPWAVRRPMNLTTRKHYAALTELLLTRRAEQRGYVSPYWCTKGQAGKFGGRVRPGQEELGVTACSMRWMEGWARDRNGRWSQRMMLVGRTFRLYNLEQLMGLGRLVPDEQTLDLWLPTRTESIARGWRGAPPVQVDRDRAFYSPILDVIAMPPRASFECEAEYYATLYHEMVHATGHASRLGRQDNPWRLRRFGSDAYAFEELVAELGARFLCSEAGIGSECAQSNSAYLGSWLAILRGDQSRLFAASVLAEKAVNLILGRSKADAAEDDEEAEDQAPVPGEGGEEPGPSRRMAA